VYVDPFDPENQVRFYRTDPTGRTSPLIVEPERTRWFERVVIGICPVVSALSLCLAFVVGWGCGGYARGTIQEQFVELSGPQRVDFIYAMSTPEIRRAIAEDWCSISHKTQRVCRNAPVYARSEK
jgi:hypothetical protein